ncbi:MAG TPA: NirA family protein, partial [Candidatus Synoicihabitans sp.]|nr:NirA family protein [Candidatus Synoicihabitans sp.]
IGAVVPVGRMSAKQMRRVADLADHYGAGELRLTVWQNFLIPHVPDSFTSSVSRALEKSGFTTEPSNSAGCVIACTGNRGCKYAAADTKAHAVALARTLRTQTNVDFPLNVHLTGCAHSCAQHYCGDIGGVGAKLADGREGYHVVLGGGMDQEQGIAREIFRGVAAEELPQLVQRMLGVYQARHQSGETFVQWTRRHSVGELQELFSA